MRQELRVVVSACLLEGIPRDDVLNREILAAAREDGVFLMLADRLRRAEFTGELRAAAVVEALRARELRTMLEALDVTGVRPVLIKGAALAYTHYERPELRPRSDVDLVIPAEARTSVAQTFTSAGYRRPPEIDGDVAIGQFHFSRTDEHGCTHAFDVHWRVSNVRAFADALTYEELSRDAVALPALGERARSASPVHALLIACIHRIAHHGDTPNLLWLYDVHLIGRSLTAEMRHAFALLAAGRQMRAVCARSLSLAQDAFGGLDARWIESLGPPATGQEPSAAFVGGGLRQIDILKSDLAETAWTARLQLLREHLFPSAAYMRQRFPRCPTLLLPLAYAWRIVTGAPRWLRR
jgi:hypothetical protein